MESINTKFPVLGYLESKQGGRPENQDDCGYADTPLGLALVVCDGMGGGPGGKTASYLAKMAILHTLYESSADADRRAVIQQAVINANEAIHQKVAEVPALRGMGTTAIILIINKQSAVAAHVGDSRIYKVRAGHIVFRTKDHSMVGEMVRNGVLTEEQARLSAQSNVITRAVGTQGNVEAEIEEIPYENGDRFLLCTDGIWGSMPEGALVKKVCASKQLSVIVENLAIEVDEIGISNGGHHDNLTLMLVQVNEDSKLKERMSKRTKQILLSLLLLLALSVVANLIQCGRGSSLLEKAAQTEQQVSERDSSIKSLSDSLSKSKLSEQKALDASEIAKKSGSVKDEEIKSLKQSLKALQDDNKQLQNNIIDLQKTNSEELAKINDLQKRLNAKNTQKNSTQKKEKKNK